MLSSNNYRLKPYEFILMSDLILFAKPLTENLTRSRSEANQGSSQETRNIAGQIVIDNHFFVQEAQLEGPAIIVERKNKGVVSKAEIRHVFRIFSMSGIYMWMAETYEDKMKWLEVLQKTAGARQKEFEFKKLTGNILLDGLSMLVLSEDPEPQPSTLLFIPEVNTEPHGWLQVRSWWDSEAQVVHVMLVEARELQAADSNGFSDPYVKLKAYSIDEQHALEHHARIHDDGKHSTGNAPRKLKPRWQAASKTIKKCLNPYWGESFTVPLSKNDRLSKNRQLLRLEVWDSNIVLKETFLGQMTVDLTRVPEFTKASAPSIYTQMPEPKHDVQSDSRPMLARRGSESRSMRVLDLTKVADTDDSIFYSLLHAQSSLAGCRGRIYWLDRGAVLLQKNKSFATGDIIEVRMGAPPAEHVEPDDDGQFAIVIHRGDKQHVLQLEAHTRGAAENWVEQLGEITPLVICCRWFLLLLSLRPLSLFMQRV